MSERHRYIVRTIAITLLLVTTSCAKIEPTGTPSNTALAPMATPVSATAPPTPTPPLTSTPAPPTPTPPLTSTPAPPTNTPVPPTATALPPTATPTAPLLQPISVSNAAQIAPLFKLEMPHLKSSHTTCGAAFSPDGRYLAAACKSATIPLWDVQSGQLARELDGQGTVWTSVSFSPDGQTLASGGSNGAIQLWDVATGQRLKATKGPQDEISELVYSPDGQLLAVSTVGPGSAIIWDATTLTRLTTFLEHGSRVNCINFSPDGTMVVSGGGDDLARVWATSTGQEIIALQGSRHFVEDVEFDPSGQYVVGASDDNRLYLWDAHSGELIHTLRGHTGPVNGVSFGPDGSFFASVSNDRSLKLWDTQGGDRLASSKEHADIVIRSPAFSPDGTLIATTAWDGMVVLWGIPDTTQALATNAPPTTQTSGDGVTVGLYADDGAAEACVTAAQAMFQWMGYSVELIDAGAINDDDISHLDILYFAGGSTGPYQRDISSAGREKIRQHINSGGCFVGTCAGALFAAERIVWQGHIDTRPTLELFPGTAQGPIPEIFADPEYGMCQVNLEPHTITGAEPDPAWGLYYNGPFFEPNPGASVDVIGKYEISGRAALLALEYGQGRVFLTGPHPEWEEDDERDGVSHFDDFEDQGSDWDSMLNASRWCLANLLPEKQE